MGDGCPGLRRNVAEIAATKGLDRAYFALSAVEESARPCTKGHTEINKAAAQWAEEDRKQTVKLGGYSAGAENMAANGTLVKGTTSKDTFGDEDTALERGACACACSSGEGRWVERDGRGGLIPEEWQVSLHLGKRSFMAPNASAACLRKVYAIFRRS